MKDFFAKIIHHSHLEHDRGRLALKHLWSTWRMDYIRSEKRQEGCVFCEELGNPDNALNLIIYRGITSFVILNRYPYTSGHVMIVPIEHQASLEDLDGATRSEMMELAMSAVKVLRTEYQAQGFNIGANIGEAAGAGITSHFHMHIVPRWGGDTNFMSSLAQTRVIPEALEETYERIRRMWEKII